MKSTKHSIGTLKRRILSHIGDEIIQDILIISGCLLLGLLLPMARIFGDMSPFGIGFAAAVTGPFGIPAFLATMIGYFLHGFSGSLRHIAALVAIIGIRWSVSGFEKVTRSPVFAPTIAFIGTVVTGSALLLTGNHSLILTLRVIAESLLAAGFAYFTQTVFFIISKPGKSVWDAKAGACAAILFSVAMVGFFSIRIAQITPACIVAVVLILTAAKAGGMTGGAIAGCCLSLSLLLAVPEKLYLVPVYSLGGMLAGMLSEQKRVVAPLAFFAVNGILTVLLTGDESTVVFSLYETLAGGIAYCLIPRSRFSEIRQLFFSKTALPQAVTSRQSAALKLEHAANAMTEVSGTVDAVSKQLATLCAPNIGEYLRTATDPICRRCQKRLTCWETHFSDTMDSLLKASKLLQKNESIEDEADVGILKEECPHFSKICLQIKKEYDKFLLRETAFRRLSELREIFADQFDGTALLLKDFAEQFRAEEWNDCQTAERIREFMLQQNIPVRDVICSIRDNNRMELELIINGKYRVENEKAFCEKMAYLCGRSFSVPVLLHESEQTRIRFSETAVFRAAIGTGQLKCKGELLCGDAFECFQDGTGHLFIVFSDGMGTGGRASVDGMMASGMTARLLKAGFGFESIVKLVNTALMAKSEDESLATLDIARIDLFSGELVVLKAGAGASLLCRSQNVCKIEEASLPLGILRELTIAQTKIRLSDGDILLMMSDGISNEGLDWVEEIMQNIDRQNTNMEILAKSIVKKARKHQETEDDITAIAVRLEKIPG